MVPARALVIEDFLQNIMGARRAFRLSPARLKASLFEDRSAKAALSKLVSKALEYRTDGIYAMHTIPPDLDDSVCEAPTDTDVGQMRKIRTEFERGVLGKTLEFGLETLVALPSREPWPYTPKQMRSLSAALDKLAAKVRHAGSEFVVQRRLELLEPPARPLQGLATDIERAASALRDSADLRVKKIRIESPNPQVSFALYLVRWIAASTGRPSYTPLSTLFEKTFLAAGKDPPKWIGRLDIEMAVHKKRRRAWGKSITVNDTNS
jgi:hypothetical protein